MVKVFLRIVKVISVLRHPYLSAVMIVAVICGVSLNASLANAQTAFKMMTGLRTGTYYPVGIAIKTLLELKHDESSDVLFEMVPSDGALNNIHALLSGEADIVFADASTVLAAITRQPPFDVYDNNASLRAIMPLWSDVGHFVVRKQSVRTGEIADFRELLGATVSFGARSAATHQAASHIFRQNGIYHDRLYRMPDLNNAQTVEAFLDDLINAFVLFTNESAHSIRLALEDEQAEATLLEVSDVQLNKLHDTEIPIWYRHVIPAGTYPNQYKSVETVAQANYIVVRSDFDDEQAYHITKTFLENMSFLEALHSSVSGIEAKHALEKSLLPLHPGAERYFVETNECQSFFCLFN